MFSLAVSGCPHLAPQRPQRAGHLLTPEGLSLWVAGLKSCSQGHSQRQPRMWPMAQALGHPHLLPPLRASRRVSRDPLFRPQPEGAASRPGGWWALRVQGMGTHVPPQGLAHQSPRGVPDWRWVCFPRKSTLQSDTLGSARLVHKGRFCSFLSLHVPQEDSEVTWQLGRFPPSPSALVAPACLQRVSFWAQLQDKKQVGLCPVDSLAGPWHQAMQPGGWQNYGQHSLQPGRPLSPPQNEGGPSSRTQPPSLGPLHLPTSLLP